MPGPRIPASWYSPRNAIIGATFAAGGLWLAADRAGPLGVVIAVPVIAPFAVIPIVVVVEWIFGRGQRAYRLGTGRQDVWGYMGHHVRGIVDGEEIWLSLADCERASGLNLSPGLKAVPVSRRRNDDVRGLMLAMRSMNRVLDACKDDFSRVNRFRLFLEREVWKVRRG